MTCRTCKWLDVPSDAAGRITPRKTQTYPCTVVVEVPRLPISVTTAFNFRRVPSRRSMGPDEGEGCPLYLHRSPPVPRKRLKVYGGSVVRNGKSRRAVIAASSVREVADAIGNASAYYVRGYWCVTGNTKEIEAALSAPGALLVESETVRDSYERDESNITGRDST